MSAHVILSLRNEVKKMHKWQNYEHFIAFSHQV